MDLDISPEVEYLQQVVVQAAKWCELHADLDDVRGCLRSHALQPLECIQSTDDIPNFRYFWQSPEQQYILVNNLSQTRARLLISAEIDAVRQNSGNGGQLLVCSPDASDWSGLSEEASGHLFDVYDVPPWDTWVSYVRETADPHCILYPYTSSQISYLLCWIPNIFVPLAELAIEVNPSACIYWVSDYKNYCTTPLLGHLAMLGL